MSSAVPGSMVVKSRLDLLESRLLMAPRCDIRTCLDTGPSFKKAMMTFASEVTSAGVALWVEFGMGLPI